VGPMLIGMPMQMPQQLYNDRVSIVVHWLKCIADAGIDV
jgi:hypothetical protein